METYSTELIADRRTNPRNADEPDLLDILLAAGDNDGITDRQLVDVLIFLFVAGYDTSKNTCSPTR